MADPRANAGNVMKGFFKTGELLRFASILPYCQIYPLRSERTADGEPEGLALFVERIGLSELRDRGKEGRIIREVRAVRHNRRLQKRLQNGWVVSPVEAE